MRCSFLFAIPILVLSVLSVLPVAHAKSEAYSRENFRFQPGYSPAGAKRTQPVRTRRMEPEERPAYANGMQRHGMGDAFGSNRVHSSQPRDWPSGMFGPYDFK